MNLQAAYEWFGFGSFAPYMGIIQKCLVWEEFHVLQVCTAILSIIGTFTDFIGVRMKMRGQDISSFNQNSEIQFNLRQKK